MNTPLPQALLLLALHDRKGTIHPSAYLAVGPGLRGALLAELRLLGRLQTQQGWLRLRGEGSTDEPLLDAALALLADLPSPISVGRALEALRAIDDLEAQVRGPLIATGVLTAQDLDRKLALRDATHYPMLDGDTEAAVVDALHDGVAAGARISPRVGTLLALVHACNLVEMVLDPKVRERARELSKWVIKRDSIAKGVDRLVEISEGTWES